MRDLCACRLIEGPEAVSWDVCDYIHPCVHVVSATCALNWDNECATEGWSTSAETIFPLAMGLGCFSALSQPHHQLLHPCHWHPVEGPETGILNFPGSLIGDLAGSDPLARTGLLGREVL